MKKFIYAMLLAIMTVIISIGVVGCGDEEWAGTTIKDWGAVKSVNGFVAETENNLYFINGQGSSTSDNTFGAPVKGALIGIKKSDFLSGDTEKAQVVVPKLFTAADYKSTIAIYGDYVYYGTPNTDKNSSGDIANDEMVIAKTKLDGTDTTVLTVLPSNSTEFRVLEKAGKIYVVYYDTADTALKVYVDGNTSIIAKTDATTNAKGYESLYKYKFVPNATGDGVAVVYTTTVYSEQYFADKADRPDYSRLTENYTNVYSYSAGESKLIESGKKGVNATSFANLDVKYEMIYANAEYFFYSVSSVNSDVEYYGVKVSELNDLSKRVKLNDGASAYIGENSVVASLEEVYTVVIDTSIDESKTTGKAYLNTLVGDEDLVKRAVITDENAKKCLFVDGDYIYYVNASDNIVRAKTSGNEVREEKVSTSSFSGNWYAPILMEVDGQKFVVYCDNSDVGSYYLACVNTGNTVIEEDLNNDDVADNFYLDGVTFIAEKLVEDEAKEINSALDNVYNSSILKFEVTDEGLTFAEYDKAKAVLDGASAEVRAAADADKLDKFKHAGKAIELMKKYYELRDVLKYNDMSDDDKTAFENAFNDAKSARDAIMNSTEYTLQTVIEMISTNYRWYYQEANELLNN